MPRTRTTTADIPAQGADDAGEPASAPRAAPFGAAAWRPWTVGLAFVGVIGLAIAGRASVPDNGGGLPPASAVAQIVVNLAPIGLALLLAGIHDTPTAGDFGLRRPPLGRATMLLLAVLIGLTALTGLWISALGLDGEEGQTLTERAGTEGPLTVIVLVIV